MLWYRIVLCGNALLFRERTRSARGLAVASASGRSPPPPRRPIRRRSRFFFAPYVGYLLLSEVLFGASWFEQAVQCRPFGSLLLPPSGRSTTHSPRWWAGGGTFLLFLNGKNAHSEFHALPAGPRPPVRCPAAPFPSPPLCRPPARAGAHKVCPYTVKDAL